MSIENSVCQTPHPVGVLLLRSENKHMLTLDIANPRGRQELIANTSTDFYVPIV